MDRTTKRPSERPQGERAAAGGGEQPSSRLHLVVGPVGAGKSTFALALSRRERALRLNLDEWMATLFRPDRPETDVLQWYRARTERCVDLIWRLAERLLDETAASVVLEIGLIQRSDRERLYERVEGCAHALTIHVVDAPRELRRARVEQRNREQGDTFSMVVPMEMFELASDLWQPLEPDECEGRDVRWVQPARKSAAQTTLP